jgi:signal transduction histidine kinase
MVASFRSAERDSKPTAEPFVAPSSATFASAVRFARAVWTAGYVVPMVATTALVLFETILRGRPVNPLVWPVVALEAVAIVSAFAVAALAAPRGWILRDRFQMRLATTFGALAINSIYFVLTYPGLRDGNALGALGLLANDDLPSFYFGLLDLWILPVGVALAAHDAEKRATDGSAARQAVAIGAMVALGAGIVIAGRNGLLPDALPTTVPTPVLWTVDHMTHLVIAFALWRLWPIAKTQEGSSVDISRQWLARALVWCLALRLASMIGAEMEVARFNVGWYLYRVARAGAIVSVVVALVRDGVRLFEIERQRMHYWKEVSCGLSALGMASTVSEMRDEATGWLERVFDARVVGSEPARGVGGGARTLTMTASTGARLELMPLRDPASGASLALERNVGFSVAEREAIEAFLSGAALSIQRARDVERAAAVKDQFLRMIGHELRTPLTSVVGFGTVLADMLDEDDTANTDAREILGRLRFHAEDLARVINAMLVTSHDLAGVTLPPMESVDIHARARTVVAAHEAEAARRELRVTVEPPSELLRAWCPAVLLDRILAILVENAVRYTPVGGLITVGFGHASPEASANVIVAGQASGLQPMVACVVRNTSDGLPGSSTTRLFEPFFRPDGAEVQRERGAGLGLFQAGRMIELMYGRIEACAHDGDGISFTVVLPAG